MIKPQDLFIECDKILFDMMVQWGYKPICCEKSLALDREDMAYKHINYDIEHGWPLCPGTSMLDESFYIHVRQTAAHLHRALTLLDDSFFNEDPRGKWVAGLKESLRKFLNPTPPKPPTS